MAPLKLVLFSKRSLKQILTFEKDLWREHLDNCVGVAESVHGRIVEGVAGEFLLDRELLRTVSRST